MTRAKFKVTKIDRSMGSKKTADGKYEPAELRTVHLSPVYANSDPNHENSKFWDATPSGSIQLGVANLPAVEMFELEKEYYVDFTPAD